MANTPARSPPPKLIVVSSRRVAQPLVHLLPSHTVKRSTTRGRAARRLTDVVAYRLGTDECAVGGPRPYATDPVPESERCVETTVRGQGDIDGAPVGDASANHREAAHGPYQTAHPIGLKLHYEPHRRAVNAGDVTDPFLSEGAGSSRDTERHECQHAASKDDKSKTARGAIRHYGVHAREPKQSPCPGRGFARGVRPPGTVVPGARRARSGRSHRRAGGAMSARVETASRAPPSSGRKPTTAWDGAA